MLFNSYVFVLLFLPLVLAGHALLARYERRRLVLAWLLAASLFFYAYWNPAYLPLLVGSIAFNYGCGWLLGSQLSRRAKQALLAAGVVGNLGLLGYFKYAHFAVDSAAVLTGAAWQTPSIVLPLAISFFTFQQIAYLVDAFRGQAREVNLLDYALFVSFFPQLIAGPIVHHGELLPQLRQRRWLGLAADDLAAGATIFILGLAKKVLVADLLAEHANLVFDSAAAGLPPTFIEAWCGLLAYTLQLYFDFSGYSDMAIGLARLFGVKLPMNFNSPYQAGDMIDFWRRWHMTLSRFLRDYLYFPLGGSQVGPARRYANLLIVMLLGGLWHGAGWTFVFWGALHGAYLCVNHAWRAAAGRLGLATERPGLLRLAAGRTVTLLAVMLAWVFFRAADFTTAGVLLGAMCGAAGWSFEARFDWAEVLAVQLALLAAVQVLPNTQQIMARIEPTSDWLRSGLAPARWGLLWRPTTWRAALLAGVGVAAIMQMSRVREFLYFQF